jgi:thiamine-monophosphate kinase
MAESPNEGPPSGDDEFEIIARHFAPLARNASARGLLDDVAYLEQAGDLIVTADAIVEGVHFLPQDPLDLVARKAIRTNVSDIAAKGGAPTHYLLTLFWPDDRDADDIAALARGLDFEQRFYGLDLLGGDTTRASGGLSLSITMFGRALRAPPVRAGAKVGDDVWITGTIGDAVLGLDALRGGLSDLSPAHRKHVINRYRIPEPRLGFAPIVAGYAHASCDVSDGLVGDAGKIAASSGVAIEIEAASLPLSEGARAWAGGDEQKRARLATGGDDYEILFTAASQARDELAMSSMGTGVPLTRIGRVTAGSGARLIGASGPIELARASFAHRLGRSAR